MSGVAAFVLRQTTLLKGGLLRDMTSIAQSGQGNFAVFLVDKTKKQGYLQVSLTLPLHILMQAE